MKSIVEEASSLTKAIEKGWIRAGKPQEFTVKVFEEAEKNFFGFTTKSAKVGILFEERHNTQPSRNQKDRSQTKRPQQGSMQQSGQQQRADRPERQQAPSQQKNERLDRGDARAPKKETSSPWSPELAQAAHDWITGSLEIMNKGDIQVKTEVNNFALKVVFNKPIFDVIEKEKLLFKSWAYLIMQALRQKNKRPLKGLKVILMSNA